MKKFHLALSTHDIDQSVQDYSKRLGAEPCVVVQGAYALWRTQTLNVSVRHDPTCAPGQLRHLGWEDATTPAFTTDTDCNGIVWERFTAEQQADEIHAMWPESGYRP